MTALDPALAQLLDEAQVSRLVARYATMTDWLDWDGVRDLFTEDAQFDFGEMYHGGRDGYLAFVAPMEEGYDRRLHLFGMPRIDVTGDGARAECASWIHTRNRGDAAHTDAVFAGRYVFEARRTGEGWRLSRLAYFLNVLDVTNPPAGPEAPTRLADDWGPGHPERPYTQAR